MAQRELRLATLLLILFLAAGCATATPTPTPTPVPIATEKVTFVAADGVTLYGTLFPGDSGLAVVLAHQGAGQTTQSSWSNFADLAAQNGVTALPFNFRRDFVGPLDLDVVAAIQFLRSRGYAKIACIGASMGGTSCLKAALTEELAGIGIIGSAWTTGGVRIEREELAGLTMPKLFVTTDNDRFTGIAATVKSIYQASPDPKEFKEYPGTAHGTEIFSTPNRDDFRALLLGFLEKLK